MADDVKYMYHIHPFKPIHKLVAGTALRKPTAMLLSKEEVKIAMESGPVYKVFPDHPSPIRIVRSEIDKYHKATYAEAMGLKVSEETPVKEVSVEDQTTPTDKVEISPVSEPEEVTESINEESEEVISNEEPEINPSDIKFGPVTISEEPITVHEDDQEEVQENQGPVRIVSTSDGSYNPNKKHNKKKH